MSQYKPTNFPNGILTNYLVFATDGTLPKEIYKESQDTLANGESITSGWVDLTLVSKYQIFYTADVVLDLTIDSRAESTGDPDLSTPTGFTGATYLSDLVPRQDWMRFTLTNNTGGDASNVRLQLKAIYGGIDGASVFPIDIAPSGFSPAMLTQSVLIGKDSGGASYRNATVNQAGALLVGDFNQEVARGTQSGYTLWNKFGYNPDIDIGAEETIWACGGIFQRMTSADTLNVYSSSASDDNGGTGVNSVVIYGIDADWNSQAEVVTMNGTTPVTTTNTWLGVNRVAIFLAGSGGVNAGEIVVETTSGANPQACMPAGDGVTQQCIFFVPANTNFVAEYIWINCLKLSGAGGSPRVQVRMTVYSDVNKATQEIFRVGIDTDVENIVSINPSLSFPIGEKSVLVLNASTDKDNTEVGARFSGTLIQDE